MFEALIANGAPRIRAAGVVPHPGNGRRFEGSSDPLAGLVPASASGTEAGLGLWIMHQLDLAVDLVQAPDGFTLQFGGGDHTTAA